MLDFTKLGFKPLIILSDGHGMDTPGKRTPQYEDGTYINENIFNSAVISIMETDLQRLGFHTYNVAPEVEDVPLRIRTDRANLQFKQYRTDLLTKGIDLSNKPPVAIFYSQHFNAMLSNWDGSDASGVETYHYPGTVEGKRLAELVHNEVIQGTQQKNRGVKSANFFVLRETIMPAVLQEAGFMDDETEAALMVQADFQAETAREAVIAICKYYGLAYEPAVPMAGGTPVFAFPSANIYTAINWSAKKQASKLFQDIAHLYWDIWTKVGLNPVLGYVQFAHETGFLYKIPSAAGIDESYHNPCGLKTTVGGGDYTASAHKKFESWEEGIQAHADHMALYAGVKGYPKEKTPDPRHFPYLFGTAKTVEQLGGKWAPSTTYGNRLVDMMKELEGFAVEQTDIREEYVETINKLRQRISEYEDILDNISGKADEYKKLGTYKGV